MYLNELRVAEFRADLKAAARGATGTGHRHRGAAIDQSRPAAGDNYRISRKCPNLHRYQILPHRSAAHAVVIEYRTQKIPELEFADFAFAVPAAHLLIQCVQELLACRRAGERGALEQRAAKPPPIEVSLR